MMEPLQSEKRPFYTVLEANVMFLVLAGVFLTLGAYVQSRSVLSGLLITEYGIILLPVLFYSLASGKDVKRVFRVRRLPLKSVGIIMGVAVTLLPIIAVANLLAIWLIETLSSAFDIGIPTASSGNEYIVLLLIISLTAGICEESLFRGVVLNAYEKAYGYKWGAIFSGLLFGLFHFNPQNLLGPIILGIVFAYMVQITDSIFAGIVAHATNNGIAVTMGFLTNLLNNEADTLAAQNELFSSTAVLVGVLVFYGLLAMITSLGLRALLQKLKQEHPRYAVGTTITIQRTQYDVLAREPQKVYLRETQVLEDDAVKVVDLNTLKRHRVKDPTPIWRKGHVHFTHLESIPLILTVIIYGYIIYLAYF